MIFDSIHYFLAPTLSEERRLQLQTALTRNGAVEVDIEDKGLTHIITNSPTFEGSGELSSEVSIVKDQWVDRAMHLGKLPPPSIYSPDPAMIFSGVVACSTGIPLIDTEVLAAGIAALGGQWRNSLTRDVTHLFALPDTSPMEPQEAEDGRAPLIPEPNSAKYHTARHYQPQTHVKILLPHWFDDAVRLGSGALPTDEYEWPSVNVLKPSHLKDSDNTENKDKDKKADRTPVAKRSILRSQILDTSSGYPLGKPSMNVWKSRKILLSHTLERAGGVLVRPSVLEGDIDLDALEAELVGKADVLITKWRVGEAYFKALKADKLIGSLSWLFHVHTGSTLSASTDQLLHYPIPRRGIEGFTSHVISVTNYTGEAREYLKRLIEAMGAKFTASMTGSNTVLIAAFIDGHKTTKAKAWSIPIVNHMWLEDCFVRWRNLTVALEKYIIFPPGVDFTKMLGERSCGKVREIEKTVLARAEEGGPEILEVVYKVGVAAVGKGLEVDIRPGNEDDTKGKKMVLTEEEKVLYGITKSDDGDPANITPSKAPGALSTAPGTSPLRTPSHRQEQDTPRARKDSSKKSTAIPASASSAKDVLEISSALVPNDVSDGDVSMPDGDALPVVSDGMDIDSPSEKGAPLPISPKRKQPKSPRKRVEVTEDQDQDEAEVATPSKSTKPLPISSPFKDVPPTSPLSSPPISPSNVRVKSTPKSPVKSSTKPPSSARRPVMPAIDLEADDDSDSLPSVGEIMNVKRQTKPQTKTNTPPKARVAESEESSASEPEVVIPPRKKLTRRSGEELDFSKFGRPISPQKSPIKSQGITTTERVDPTAGRPRTSLKDRMKPSPKKPTVSESEDELSMQAASRRPTQRNARASSSKVPLSDSDEDEEQDEDSITVYKHPLPKEVVPTPLEDAEHPRPPSPEKATATKGKAISKPPKLYVISSSFTIIEAPAPAKPKPRRSAPSQITRNKPEAPPEDPIEDEDDSVIHDADPPPAEIRRGRRLPSPPPAVSQKPKGKGKKSDTNPVVDVDVDEAVEVSAPVVRSRRSAATKASQRLRDEVMPDVMNYQKQMSRSRKSGGLPDFFKDEGSSKGSAPPGEPKNGKRKSDAADGGTGDKPDEDIVMVEPPAQGNGRKKRKLDTADTMDVDPPLTASITVVKSKASNKAKTVGGSPTKSAKLPRTIKLLTTQITLPENTIKVLNKLGVKVTTKPADCTHLIAPHLVRTEKFLCALAVNPYILSSTWATASATANELLPEEDYYLVDSANEAKYNIKLGDVLERAKVHLGRLFAKQTFYVTPKVPVAHSLLKNVITANGGQMVVQAPKARTFNSPDKHLISCPEDLSIWRPLCKDKITVYNSELVLASALRQEIDWEDDTFKVPGSF
ncbi:hypothetical protein ONZ45_g17284 [Pleurotus djamor]|nr:hypothetical protein ONZ45_g17284 [Pleurotus djamor]